MTYKRTDLGLWLFGSALGRALERLLAMILHPERIAYINMSTEATQNEKQVQLDEYDEFDDDFSSSSLSAPATAPAPPTTQSRIHSLFSIALAVPHIVSSILSHLPEESYRSVVLLNQLWFTATTPY